MAARRGRPRKFRNNTGGELYPEGTPIDEATGFPPEEAEIEEDIARQIPLDEESARVASQHRNVIKRKAAGEPMVKWSADPRIRYSEAVRMQPLSRVMIRMIEPHEDDNIPTRPVSQLRDYDLLIRHIRDSHWKGQQAVYKWVIGDDNQPQWATGTVKFGPQPEDRHREQQQPYGYPNPNPYGGVPPLNPMAPMSPNPYGYGPNGYGQNPYYPPQQQMGMGMPFAQQQQPQYVPQPQPAPAPEPVREPQAASIQMPPYPASAPNYDVVQGLLGYIERLSAALMEQRNQVAVPQPAPNPLSQIPPHLLPLFFQQAQAQHPPQQQAPPPPAPPPSPIEFARDAMMMIKTMNAMGKQIAEDFSPAAEPEKPLVANPDDESSPYIVQDIGPIRHIRDRETGERPSLLTEFVMNGDKAGALVDGFLKKVTGVMHDRVDLTDKAQKQALDNAKQLAALQREIADSQERIARAKTQQVAVESALRLTQHQETPAPPAPTMTPATPFVPAPAPEQKPPPVDEKPPVQSWWAAAPIPVESAPPVPRPMVIAPLDGANGTSEEPEPEMFPIPETP